MDRTLTTTLSISNGKVFVDSTLNRLSMDDLLSLVTKDLRKCCFEYGL